MRVFDNFHAWFGLVERGFVWRYVVRQDVAI